MIDLNKLYEKGLFNGLTDPSQINVPIFPSDVFASKIQEVINETHNALQYPVDFTGCSILFAASVAIGNTYKLKVMNTYVNSSLLYIALVGRAGSVKTHPVNFALKPLIERDKENYKNYISAKEKYETIVDMSKEEKSKLAQENLGKPELKQIILTDQTPEALHKVHNINKRGIGLFKDELISWFNDLNRYNKGSEQELWLQNWSGSFVKINRISRDPIYIAYPFIGVIGTIQPSLLFEIVKDNRGGNGYKDRILFAAPGELRKEYFSSNELSQNLIDEYSDIISKILLIEEKYDSNDDVYSEIIEFSSEAKKRYIEWYNFNADLMNETVEKEDIVSLFSKLEIYVARLALILQTLYMAADNDTISSVSLKATEGAIRLVEYFRMTGLKVHLKINAENNRIDKLPEKERAIELIKTGMSNVDVAKKLKKSEGTIRNWRKENGM